MDTKLWRRVAAATGAGLLALGVSGCADQDADPEAPIVTESPMETPDDEMDDTESPDDQETEDDTDDQSGY